MIHDGECSNSNLSWLTDYTEDMKSYLWLLIWSYLVRWCENTWSPTPVLGTWPRAQNLKGKLLSWRSTWWALQELNLRWALHKQMNVSLRSLFLALSFPLSSDQRAINWFVRNVLHVRRNMPRLLFRWLKDLWPDRNKFSTTDMKNTVQAYQESRWRLDWVVNKGLSMRGRNEQR